MILSFINILKVPREGLKPRDSPSVLNTYLETLRMLMNGKSCLIPLLLHTTTLRKHYSVPNEVSFEFVRCVITFKILKTISNIFTFPTRRAIINIVL